MSAIYIPSALLATTVGIIVATTTVNHHSSPYPDIQAGRIVTQHTSAVRDAHSAPLVDGVITPSVVSGGVVEAFDDVETRIATGTDWVIVLTYPVDGTVDHLEKMQRVFSHVGEQDLTNIPHTEIGVVESATTGSGIQIGKVEYLGVDLSVSSATIGKTAIITHVDKAP